MVSLRVTGYRTTTPIDSLKRARSGSSNMTASVPPLSRSISPLVPPYSRDTTHDFHPFSRAETARRDALFQLFLPIWNDRLSIVTL